MASSDRLASAAESVLSSPLRNLAGALIFVATVFVLSTTGFIWAGWSLGDAAYMVTLTIFSVGYDEVHPVDTSFLRLLTTVTIIFGCTGMIVLTGALVQVFTVFQIRNLLGFDRMQAQIDRLENHVIICGFGRIGVQLASELQAAKTPFVVIERDANKTADALAQGLLCLTADATEEKTLLAAQIERAQILATVVPDDAANVFITLSARNLNPELQIIARGEVPTTESKLLHAGADKVVLPMHIGAERIAEMILYPATEGFVDGAPTMLTMKRSLHEYGLELEVVRSPANGTLTGETVAEAERRGQGAFFIVRIDRTTGQSISHPPEDLVIEPDDRVVLVVRGSRVAAGAIFATPKGKVRVGRMDL